MADQPPTLRAFDDAPAVRTGIYDRALQAVKERFPIEDDQYRLELHNPRYRGPQAFDLEEQKQALLKDRNLQTAIVGTWKLVHKPTNTVLDSRDDTIMQIPYYTDRGTLIRGGNEYSCFHPTTRIETDQGALSIGEIVNRRLRVRVRSYDFVKGEVVYRPIVDWICHRRKPNELLVCNHFNSAGCGNDGCSTLWSTPEHKVYKPDGSNSEAALAEQVTLIGDKLSYTQTQLLYGGLLGDSTIDLADATLRFLHCQKQREYLEFKQSIWGSLASEIADRISGSGPGSSGCKHPNASFSVHASFSVREAAKLCYPGTVPHHKKQISQEWLDKVDALGLAFWFMDDGSARRLGVRTDTPIVALSTEGFDDPGVQLLSDWLKTRWGFDNFVDKRRRYSGRTYGSVIHLSGRDSVYRFLRLISPYVVECMRYKLLRPPKMGRCGCGVEISRNRRRCVGCLEKLLQEPKLSKSLRHHFPGKSRSEVRELLRSGQLGNYDKMYTDWLDIQRLCGSGVEACRRDNAIGTRLVETRASKALEDNSKCYASAPYVYDITVEGTHNYFANGILVSNCASQARLRPGVYVRRQRTGEIEAHLNVLPGSGKPFRIHLEPKTGVFKVNVGQSNIPIYPMLRAAGVKDQDIIKAWGPELTARNTKHNPKDLQKLYARFAGYKADPAATEAIMSSYFKDEFPKYRLDPEVMARTMGLPHAEGITPEVLLRTTSKMLGVSKGHEEPDDRDAPQFAHFYGPEDLVEERIRKDAGNLTKTMLYKVRRHKSLKGIYSGALNSYVESLVQGSGLVSPLDETNPLSTLEQQNRVTKLGEGGIGSAEAITEEARDINPGQLGMIDFIAGPERGTVGVDVRMSHGARKGSDQKLYGEFRDARTGKPVHLEAMRVADSVVAFPGQMARNTPTVAAMKKGQLQEVPREEVQYEVPSTGHMFSSHINLNPMPTGVQAGRQFYGAKFWSQYLPQVKGEVPLVDSLMPDGKATWSEYYGRKVGTRTSPIDGTVVKVTDKAITVQGRDGFKHVEPLVKNLPFNRLSGVSYFPAVEAGQAIKAGDMLAHSNFTDQKTGAMALGQNLRVAVIPAKGHSYEDAVVISQSAAEKMATERLHGFDLEARHGVELGRSRYISLFPRNFTQAQVETLDDQGVAKPGTVLRKGDPIVLATGPKLLTPQDSQLGKLHKVLRNAVTDKSLTWEYSWPGTVTDVGMTRSGARVYVKSTPPVTEGDKLCYDDQTEILTRTGWKYFKGLTVDDEVAALDPDSGVFDYQAPQSVQQYQHSGRMYRLKSQQIDLMVTDNHRLLVQRRGSNRFELLPPGEVFGKRVSHKKNGVWKGTLQKTIRIPGVPRGHRWGPIDKPDLELPVNTFLMILGMFLSEGNCFSPQSSYGIEFTQKKGPSSDRMVAALAAAGFRDTYNKKSGKFRIYSHSLLNYFRQFGHAHDKFIPDWVFGLPAENLKVLFDWLMWGDGHSEDGRPIVYTTISPRLADGVQRLCLHIGYAANITLKPISKNRAFIGGREIISRYPCYDVRIVTTKLTPTVNHSHVRTQTDQTEDWVQYSGTVYCCTLAKGHVLYVRRNGKAVWCGNSSRFAIKGVVGSVIPEDKMPRNAVTNQPYDMLLNPMTILSRVAPNQIVEMALGKVAQKTGKQIRIPQDPPAEGWARWAQKIMKENGVEESSDIFDPASGKTVKGIGDGVIYMLAFHHLAEKKLSARGDAGAYDANEQPVRGGMTGSKKFGSLDANAALSHGATNLIRDVQTIRGTKNEDYWKALKLGKPLPEPAVPFIYEKFLNTLKAGGINLRQQGDSTQLLPMTDRDVEKLSRGPVQKSDMVDSDFEPIPGGLFDVGKTGGAAGKHWTHIDLPEPVPNPIMEEPVRRLLGLRVKDMEAILSGTQELGGLTGGAALKKALSRINIDDMIEENRQKVRTTRGTNRDNAVKILGYLQSAKEQGIHPETWMVQKVPVIPPVFRPVSRMGDVALTADLNELYRDVMETARTYKELAPDLPPAELAEERLNLYRAIKAAYGLGDPLTPEGRAKGLKGAIRQVIGDSPKHGMWQSQVISKNVDLVGRGVITPDPNLDMDQMGIPEDSAWTLYKDFVMRRLVQHGYPAVRASEMIEKRAPEAREMLDKEMATRVIVADRAPTWHKFNLLAFHPHIAEGHTVRVCPLVTKGFNADHDGDQMNFHVPASDKANQEAKDRMLPSRNLFSLTDLRSVRHSPSMEMTAGLFSLTRPPTNKKVKAFASYQAAKAAYEAGEIGPNDPIQISG